MAELTINETNNIVILSTYDESLDFDGKAFSIGSVDCALFNIIDTLQSHFCINEIDELPTIIENSLCERLTGKDEYYDLCGIIRCRKTNLVPIMVFLSRNEA